MRYKVKPLEELLSDKYAGIEEFRRLRAKLKEYLPAVDAAQLSWHLTIPQFRTKQMGLRAEAIKPQYDTLHCVYCDGPLNIPMEYPRFDPQTYRQFKEVYHTPNGAQTCPCGNLNTLTDPQGNLRVYLTDGHEASFKYYCGPINLLEGARDEIEEIHCHNVFDSPRPADEDPFSFNVRNDTHLNHINLYKVSLKVQHILLPVEDPREYARAYNIVIFGSSHVYFPTGHAIEYQQFKDSDSFSFLLDPIVTPERATARNKWVQDLFFHSLPPILAYNHQKLTKILSKRLREALTYAPSQPYAPYMVRLQRAKTAYGRVPGKIYRPLTIYRETTILRLPFFKAKAPKPVIQLQDFYPFWKTSLYYHKYPQYFASVTHLKALKAERGKLLHYLLARFTLGTPEGILQHALNTLPRTTPAPTYQPNYTLLKLTEPPTIS